MNPIALWLLSQAGAKLFNTTIDALAEITGIKVNLLEDYSQRLEDASRRVIDRLDQDRLAILRSAIDQLKRAPKTVFKRETLADALSKFSLVAHLAEQGQTGGFPNAQLRSIALLGIAAVHLELQDPKDVIAENIGAAVDADSATAEQWLGRNIVGELLVAAVQSLANKRLVKKAPPDWGAFSFELRFSQDGASYTERHIDSNGQPYPGIVSVVSNGIRLQSPNSPYYTVISGNKGVEYLNDSRTGVVYELLWEYNLAEEFADTRLPRTLRRFRPGMNFTCQFLPNGEYTEQREGHTQIVLGSWIVENNVTIEETTYPVVIYISGLQGSDAEYSFRLYSNQTGLKTISYRNGQFFGHGTAAFIN